MRDDFSPRPRLLVISLVAVLLTATALLVIAFWLWLPLFMTAGLVTAFSRSSTVRCVACSTALAVVAVVVLIALWPGLLEHSPQVWRPLHSALD